MSKRWFRSPNSHMALTNEPHHFHNGEPTGDQSAAITSGRPPMFSPPGQAAESGATELGHSRRCGPHFSPPRLNLRRATTKKVDEPSVQEENEHEHEQSAFQKRGLQFTPPRAKKANQKDGVLEEQENENDSTEAHSKVEKSAGSPPHSPIRRGLQFSPSRLSRKKMSHKDDSQSSAEESSKNGMAAISPPQSPPRRGFPFTPPRVRRRESRQPTGDPKEQKKVLARWRKDRNYSPNDSAPGDVESTALAGAIPAEWAAITPGEGTPRDDETAASQEQYDKACQLLHRQLLGDKNRLTPLEKQFLNQLLEENEQDAVNEPLEDAASVEAVLKDDGTTNRLNTIESIIDRTLEENRLFASPDWSPASVMINEFNNECVIAGNETEQTPRTTNLTAAVTDERAILRTDSEQTRRIVNLTSTVTNERAISRNGTEQTGRTANLPTVAMSERVHAFDAREIQWKIESIERTLDENPPHVSSVSSPPLLPKSNSAKSGTVPANEIKRTISRKDTMQTVRAANLTPVSPEKESTFQDGDVQWAVHSVAKTLCDDVPVVSADSSPTSVLVNKFTSVICSRSDSTNDASFAILAGDTIKSIEKTLHAANLKSIAPTENAFDDGDIQWQNVAEADSIRGPPSPVRRSSSGIFDDEEKESPYIILGNPSPTPIMTESLMEAMRGFLPKSVDSQNYWLKYDSSRDEVSITSVLLKIRASYNALICILATDGSVFGSFTESPWRLHGDWYGSHDSFLFRKFQGKMEVYPCTGTDSHVQYCSAHMLAVGGGEWHGDSPYGAREAQGIGLLIDGDLAGGETNSCSTFANPRLSDGEARGNEFGIERMEIWTFTSARDEELARDLEFRKLFLENDPAQMHDAVAYGSDEEDANSNIGYEV